MATLTSKLMHIFLIKQLNFNCETKIFECRFFSYDYNLFVGRTFIILLIEVSLKAETRLSKYIFRGCVVNLVK